MIGDGTVALLAVQLVRMWAPSAVAMAGRRPEQQGLAAAASVDHFTVEPRTPRRTTSSSRRPAAPRPRRPRSGRPVLGMAGHGKAANLFVDDVVNKDLRIRGSSSYTAAVWATTVRLLNSGRFRPLPLVTHRVALHEFQEALDLLATPTGEPRGKILVDMGAGA